MSQRSTKVRPCPCPGHPPIFPGPAGSSRPAQLAGSRLRVQKEGTDSASRAQALGLSQPGSPSPAHDPSPGGGRRVCLEATASRKENAFCRQYDAVS